MKRFVSALIALLLLPIPVKASLEEDIDKTVQFLMTNWKADKTLKDFYPPQVLAVPSGTKVFGGCGKFITGHSMDGSGYCPKTHTVVLDLDQLRLFHEGFGISSIAFVISHEFAHAVQSEFEIILDSPNHELQADCIAGVFIAKGNQELGITREDTLSMSWVAYNIGSRSHGSGPQRAYALLAGMGLADLECTQESIQKLANSEIEDPLYKKLVARKRSGVRTINLGPTPFPKTTRGSLGLYWDDN